MSKPAYINKWKEYHEFLEDEKASAFRETICTEIGCSYTTFFRKLKDPENLLSPAEKKAIAQVYKLPVTFLFPELESQTA